MIARQGNAGARVARDASCLHDLLDELEEGVDRQLEREADLARAATAPLLPSGNRLSVTAICPCGRRIDSGLRSDARYCSNACRQRAYRERSAR